MSSPPDDGPAPALLRVVRGEPTPEQLAALVAVLTARTARTGPPVAERASPDRGRWGRPALRAPLTAGPGAWRASALPR